MAAPTNTLISNNAVGNRESLHNIISILNKDETPFQAAIGSGSAEATYEEWQLDALGNADTTNAQLEGDDTTAAAITPTFADDPLSPLRAPAMSPRRRGGWASRRRSFPTRRWRCCR